MHAKRLFTLLFLGLCVLGAVLARGPVETADPLLTRPEAGKDAKNLFLTKNRDLYGNFDAKKLTPKQLLERLGIANAIPYFADMLDHADQMFKYATRDQHFVMVNRVLEALKQSFLRTIDLVRNAPEQLPQVIDGEMMDQVVDVTEQHFHDQLQKDPDVDLGQIEPFFRSYADAFFGSLKTGYKQLFGMGISLTWTIVHMVTPYIERLDTTLIDRDMFQDVLDAPDHLKQFLYDQLAEIMTGDYGHFVQMALTLLSTIDLKKLVREKVEL